MAIVGFEQTSYTIVEGAGEVEICVIVYQPSGDIPVEFPFEVDVRTDDGTAGKYTTAIDNRTLYKDTCLLVLTPVYLSHVVEPGDYTGAVAVLMFREGRRQNCISIPIVRDFELEENEEFHVTLVQGAVFNPAITLEPAVTTILIIDGERDTSSLCDYHLRPGGLRHIHMNSIYLHKWDS